MKQSIYSPCPRSIARMQEEGRQVVTLADEIVQSTLTFSREVDFAALAEEVNRTYWQDLQTSERQRAVEATNAMLRALAASAGMIFLDRLNYICRPAQQSCDTMSDDLLKHFYDEAHTMMEGARHFGRRIDALNWFKAVLTD